MCAAPATHGVCLSNRSWVDLGREITSYPRSHLRLNEVTPCRVASVLILETSVLFMNL